jgi:hypothetical protein
MIKIVPDVVAPVVVTAADLITQKVQPTWNEWVCYGLTAVGYISAFMGLGKGETNDFLKNLGVASLPLTARHIYDRVTTPGIPARVGNRLSYHPAMNSIRQTTVPEYGDIKVS